MADRLSLADREKFVLFFASLLDQATNLVDRLNATSAAVTPVSIFLILFAIEYRSICSFEV